MTDVQDATKCCGRVTHSRVIGCTGGYHIVRWCRACGPISDESGVYKREEDATMALQKGLWKEPGK